MIGYINLEKNGMGTLDLKFIHKVSRNKNVEKGLEKV